MPSQLGHTAALDWPHPDLGRAHTSRVLAAFASATDISDFGVDVEATLEWAVGTGADVATAPVTDVWQLLASTAFIDVGAARIVEPHFDALRILAEAQRDDVGADFSSLGVDASSTWGVFAAEGNGVRLTARESPRGWVLSGTKPWCSLAASLTHALVTAWVDDDRRGLFAVRLQTPHVVCHEGPWVARGLAQVVSAAIDVDDAPAIAVGGPGWYLSRRGFAEGGVGVAAAWWGAACALLAPLHDAARAPRADQIALLHLGEADAALWSARASLIAAAEDFSRDGGDALAASRVRTIVAHAAEQALRSADHALGPSPLVRDESHARRVADLALYLRQHHGERDTARIGRDLARGPAAW
jgi:hypothetical protein